MSVQCGDGVKSLVADEWRVFKSKQQMVIHKWCRNNRRWLRQWTLPIWRDKPVCLNCVLLPGWTNYSEVRYSIPDLTVIDTTTYSRSIRQNGGVYYCATDLQTQVWYNDSLSMDDESVYVSDSQWCYIQNGRYEYCYTSKSGDPSVASAYSEQYCSYPNCP